METKNKGGRPKKEHSPITASVPNDFIEFVKTIGHGSVSLGIRLFWEKAKDMKSIQGLTKGK